MKKSRKASVLVRLKPEVLDPQGDAIAKALASLGVGQINRVRVGKLVEIELGEVGSTEDARAKLAACADAILANPIIEDYEIVLS